MSKEHAYAYESGYQDGLRCAKAESARLRDKYDSYEQKMDALVWTLTDGLLSKSASTPNDVLYSTAEESLTERLQSENAKLRELIRDMWQAWWACDNEKCPRYSKHCDTEEFCAFDDCMRELGIMVQS